MPTPLPLPRIHAMHIGVVSDTHSDLRNVHPAFELFTLEPGILLFRIDRGWAATLPLRGRRALETR